MRLLINILSLLTLLVLLSADNCSGPDVNYKEENREKQISETYQSIENKFIKVELSVEDLNAFEKRAIQKLKDVSDYMNIYADASFSVQFREQADQMIQESFLKNTDCQNFYKKLELLEDTVNRFLYHSGNLGIFKTEFDSFTISERLSLKSGSDYNGEIQFSQKVFLINSADTVATNNSQFRLKILAKKTRKNFGDITEDVWEVFLGEVKL